MVGGDNSSGGSGTFSVHSSRQSGGAAPEAAGGDGGRAAASRRAGSGDTDGSGPPFADLWKAVCQSGDPGRQAVARVSRAAVAQWLRSDEVIQVPPRPDRRAVS